MPMNLRHFESCVASTQRTALQLRGPEGACGGEWRRSSAATPCWTAYRALSAQYRGRFL